MLQCSGHHFVKEWIGGLHWRPAMAISRFRQDDAGVGYLKVLTDAEERNLIWIIKLTGIDQICQSSDIRGGVRFRMGHEQGLLQPAQFPPTASSALAIQAFNNPRKLSRCAVVHAGIAVGMVTDEVINSLCRRPGSLAPDIRDGPDRRTQELLPGSPAQDDLFPEPQCRREQEDATIDQTLPRATCATAQILAILIAKCQQHSQCWIKQSC